MKITKAFKFTIKYSVLKHDVLIGLYLVRWLYAAAPLYIR